MSKTPIQRCAIYTRKSSDEGLDQAFNSLDAQREAGEAYVKSQAHEGWRLVPNRYDDGGYSGGTMERPGLQRLLLDVGAGRIDVVVVYKIDRLTRSLADFARIVERFDARGVSFVSVTQAFNTTSSMGRLTLNVLLSFAQFEREVTGERIRDKIAASKAKGLWMGGIPPLGYDLPAPGTRALQINDTEAATVRAIFVRYLELGSVHRLRDELEANGTLSKRWVTAGGKITGGVPLSRGALFPLLSSPVYLGKIVHKGAVHQGEHPAIVDVAVFEAVQQALASRRRRTAESGERRTAAFPLTGKLRDATGEPMSPVHARGRRGQLYRYYVSGSLQQGTAASRDDTVRRLPARAIEELVTSTLAAALPGVPPALDAVRAVRLDQAGVTIHLPRSHRRQLAAVMVDGITSSIADGELVLTRAVHLPLRGGRRSISPGAGTTPVPDAALVAALRKAHALLGRDAHGPLLDAAPASWYERRLVRLALLAPDLQRDILAGRQPASLTLQAFLRSEIPADWGMQRSALGWR